MRDRLIELLKGVQPPFNALNDSCISELADYLLERGVILLPCKVGDVVYQTDGVDIYEHEVCEISLSKQTVTYYTENVVAFDETALGKSIFLTKEEAERKLIK